MSNPNPPNQPSEITRKRPYPGIKHNLYEINLERKTAFCTACGYTGIHVSKSRTKHTPKIFCINRFRELRQENNNRKSQARRLQPGWKPRHLLSEIDTKKMKALCSVCGRIEIRKRTHKQSIYYMCAKKARVYGRKYHRTHYASQVSNPRVHTLSQIDEEKKTAVCSLCGPVSIYIWQGERKMGRRCSNASVTELPPAQKIRREININLINEYKVEHGCKYCGYNANLNFLDLHRRRPDQKVPKIEKLLKLARKDLMQELENCEVQCIYCRSLVNNELGRKTPSVFR